MEMLSEHSLDVKETFFESLGNQEEMVNESPETLKASILRANEYIRAIGVVVNKSEVATLMSSYEFLLKEEDSK